MYSSQPQTLEQLNHSIIQTDIEMLKQVMQNFHARQQGAGHMTDVIFKK